MDPFATLGLSPCYEIDLAKAERTHRELSRTLHPDRYAQAGASERRAALEKATLVNEAWRIVRDPIRRAEALFERAGVKVGENHEPKPDGAFLMEMLELREELAEAKATKDLGRVRALADGIEGRCRTVTDELSRGFAGEPGDAEVARLLPKLGELRFYRRFLDEVALVEDESEVG
jgi:molecular chaperone HscB